MKGRVHNELRERVRLAQSGLERMATDALLGLQQKVGDLLGSKRFDPASIADESAEVLRIAAQFRTLIDMRNDIAVCLDRVLRLPRVFFWALLVGAIAELALVGCISGAITSPWTTHLQWTSGSVFLLCALVLLVAFLRHDRHLETIASAEILSRSDETDE